MKAAMLALCLAGVFGIVRHISAEPKASPITPRIANRGVLDTLPPGHFEVDLSHPQFHAYPPDPNLPLNIRGKIYEYAPSYGPVDPSRLAH